MLLISSVCFGQDKVATSCGFPLSNSQLGPFVTVRLQTNGFLILSRYEEGYGFDLTWSGSKDDPDNIPRQTVEEYNNKIAEAFSSVPVWIISYTFWFV